MTSNFVVCLISITILYCSNLSYARQVPKECSKGPEVWCQSLKRGADCGAVGHCIATVWETENINVSPNEISVKFVRLFRQLKDVKDLINEEYLAARISSACHDVQYPAGAKICKENTADLENYMHHVLKSDTSPETMCKIIGMCNNMKLDNIISINKKKTSGTNKHKEPLLGSMRCSWGPSYWCSNFSTGHECKATHHCVSRVWSKFTYPEDTDDICKICTDMVKQARDQLESNTTQEELKEVFEGSCNLIPIKLVAKECMRLADDFVPELVETLASQMNPQAVCSVAGLCNNVKIDTLLLEYNSQKERVLGCNSCQSTVGALRKKYDQTPYEDFLVGLLKVCREMDSLSDSCSMLVFKYYENIVEAVKKDLTPQSVCHVSGQCTHKFHTHSEFTFPQQVHEFASTDDVPCEFCEQLVTHLRDVLIANTTELEFYKVLQGLCKQTGNFKDECLHLSEQYYSIIYNFLVNDLKPDSICKMMGMCDGKATDVPVSPLVAKELIVKAITPSSKQAEETKIARVAVAKKQTNVRVIGEVKEEPTPLTLPIERMFVAVPQSKVGCSFCQYFLHYLQVELSDSRTEAEVTDAVEKACAAFPQSVSEECQQFVTQYGPAVIALIVQEIDPASVCPAIGICPQVEEVKHVDINSGKSNCPLCLFAVEQLETMLKDNHTEENIRKALDGLCTHLSQKLRTQCVDFVETYTNQLVEMLVSDMSAQEICVFLKLCTNQVHDPLNVKTSPIDKYHEKPELRGDRNNFRKKSLLPAHMLETGKGDIETNEIPDNTINGRPVKRRRGPSTACVVCEFVLKEIDDQIKDKHNEDEVKKVVHSVCRRMPKSVRAQCDQFVDKYADLVISLLAQELDPSEVCTELKLCKTTAPNFDKVRGEILDCAVCETVVMAVKKVLSNDAVDRNIVHVVEKSCNLLPAKYSARCHTMMEVYGDSVIHLIEEFGVKGVCQKIGLCSDTETAYVRMYRN